MPDTTLKLEQVQAAMAAMMAKAQETPDAPVAMAIVDSTGNLEAYAKMDNLRMFSRRHALRKAYTAAIMGLNTGAHAERLHGQGRSISELGDPNLTHGQGGLVIMQGRRNPRRHRRRRLPQRPVRRRPRPRRPRSHEPLGVNDSPAHPEPVEGFPHDGEDQDRGEKRRSRAGGNLEPVRKKPLPPRRGKVRMGVNDSPAHPEPVEGFPIWSLRQLDSPPAGQYY